MIVNRTRLICIRTVTATLLLLSIAAALFFTRRAGFKLWWEIGVALLAAPGCLVAAGMFSTLVELRQDQVVNHVILARLAHQLRLGAIFSFTLLSWMALSAVKQWPPPTSITWIVPAGVALVFPAALLLAAHLTDEVANGRPSNSG